MVLGVTYINAKEFSYLMDRCCKMNFFWAAEAECSLTAKPPTPLYAIKLPEEVIFTPCQFSLHNDKFDISGGIIFLLFKLA